MSDDRIHLLNNGATDRQKKKVANQNATVGEVNEAIQRLQVESEKMVQWYLTQLPELVARMVVDALMANGLHALPPQPVWDQYRVTTTSAIAENHGVVTVEDGYVAPVEDEC